MAYGRGLTAHRQGAVVEIPVDLAEDGAGLFVVEATYGYSPGLGKFLVGKTISMSAKAYQVPRLGSCVVLIIHASEPRFGDDLQPSDCVIYRDAGSGQ